MFEFQRKTHLGSGLRSSLRGGLLGSILLRQLDGTRGAWDASADHHNKQSHGAAPVITHALKHKTEEHVGEQLRAIRGAQGNATYPWAG